MTVQEWLKQHEIAHIITLVAQDCHEALITGKDWHHDMWAVVLKTPTHTFSTFYKTGTGLRRNGVPKRPTIDDVLECLAYEHEVLNQSRAEWMGEMCCEGTPAEAINIYEKCYTQARDLQQFLPAPISEILNEY